MNQRTAIIGWFASLLLLVVTVSNSFATVALTKQAGGQVFELSGYQVFPVANALILMQGAAFLVSFLIPVSISRVISAALVPVMIWHLVLVITTLEDSIAKALAFKVASITGVSGLEGQLALVASASEGPSGIIYSVAVALNVLVLLVRAVVKLSASQKRRQVDQNVDPSELWDAQR